MYLLKENVEVISDDGYNVKFRGKCPFCGTTDISVRTLPISESGTSNVTHTCPKCGKNYFSRMRHSSYYRDSF